MVRIAAARRVPIHGCDLQSQSPRVIRELSHWEGQFPVSDLRYVCSNVIVIVVMLVVFAVAILAPFPGRARGGWVVVSVSEERFLDRARARAGGWGAAAREAAARRAAVVCRVVDLRVRGAVAGRAGRDHRLGLDPRAEGPGLVALHRDRPLLQQHPPVGRSSCSSSSWSSTCGASTGWRPGAAAARGSGSPARSPSWSRSRAR